MLGKGHAACLAEIGRLLTFQNSYARDFLAGFWLQAAGRWLLAAGGWLSIMGEQFRT